MLLWAVLSWEINNLKRKNVSERGNPANLINTFTIAMTGEDKTLLQSVTTFKKLWFKCRIIKCMTFPNSSWQIRIARWDDMWLLHEATAAKLYLGILEVYISQLRSILLVAGVCMSSRRLLYTPATVCPLFVSIQAQIEDCI